MIFDTIFSSVENVPAHFSFDKGINSTRAGQKTSRFSIKSHPDDRFRIAAKLINRWNPFDQIYRFLSKLLGYTVEVKTSKDEVILFNINSLASRLHVEKQDIKEAAANGVFEQFLKKITEPGRIEKLSNQYIDKIYNDVIALFDVIDHQLVYKNDGVQTGLTDEDLRNGIKEAFASNRKNPAEQKKSFRFWRDAQGKPVYLIKRLGSGSYSKVYVFFDCLKGIAGVFKDARRSENTSFQREARTDVKNEYQLLIEIHREGIAWGIQAKPQRLDSVYVQKKNDQTKERFGLIGQKYDLDYETDIKGSSKDPKKVPIKPLEECLSDFHQLLGGLKRLHALNLLHGDIKPENILIKRTPAMKWVHIADLGGACRAYQKGPLHDLVAYGGLRAATPNYMTVADLEKSLQLAKEGKRDELVKMEQKRDVFSMGCVLQYALTGKRPYPCCNKGYPKLDFYRPIERDDIPKEIKDLIRSMIDPNAKQRPLAEEAFTKIDQFIQQNHPILYASIQAEIARGFIV